MGPSCLVRLGEAPGTDGERGRPESFPATQNGSLVGRERFLVAGQRFRNFCVDNRFSRGGAGFLTRIRLVHEESVVAAPADQFSWARPWPKSRRGRARVLWARWGARCVDFRFS